MDSKTHQIELHFHTSNIILKSIKLQFDWIRTVKQVHELIRIQTRPHRMRTSSWWVSPFLKRSGNRQRHRRHNRRFHSHVTGKFRHRRSHWCQNETTHTHIQMLRIQRDEVQEREWECSSRERKWEIDCFMLVNGCFVSLSKFWI